MSNLTPLIAIHMTVAIAATVIGPFAMWARLGMFTLFGTFRFLAQGIIIGH